MAKAKLDRFDLEAIAESDAITLANKNRPYVSRLRKTRTETMCDYGTLCIRPIRTGEKHRKIR